MSEQHAGKYITDVLTLHAGPRPEAPPRRTSGGGTVADAPPKVRRQLSLSAAARSRRKTLAIRHVSGHRLVALLEIISPANKDLEEHIEEFLNKMEDALRQGIHLLVVDLFGPGPHDPDGIHGAIWDRLGDVPEAAPADEPLTLAAYVADTPVRAYLEHLAVGRPLPDMQLFLDPGYYIDTPLETTYQATWLGTPQPWREVLEAGSVARGKRKAAKRRRRPR